MLEKQQQLNGFAVFLVKLKWDRQATEIFLACFYSNYSTHAFLICQLGALFFILYPTADPTLTEFTYGTSYETST